MGHELADKQAVLIAQNNEPDNRPFDIDLKEAVREVNASKKPNTESSGAAKKGDQSFDPIIDAPKSKLQLFGMVQWFDEQKEKLLADPRVKAGLKDLDQKVRQDAGTRKTVLDVTSAANTVPGTVNAAVEMGKHLPELAITSGLSGMGIELVGSCFAPKVRPFIHLVAGTGLVGAFCIEPYKKQEEAYKKALLKTGGLNTIYGASKEVGNARGELVLNIAIPASSYVGGALGARSLVELAKANEAKRLIEQDSSLKTSKALLDQVHGLLDGFSNKKEITIDDLKKLDPQLVTDAEHFLKREDARLKGQQALKLVKDARLNEQGIGERQVEAGNKPEKNNAEVKPEINKPQEVKEQVVSADKKNGELPLEFKSTTIKGLADVIAAVQNKFGDPGSMKMQHELERLNGPVREYLGKQPRLAARDPEYTEILSQLHQTAEQLVAQTAGKRLDEQSRRVIDYLVHHMEGHITAANQQLEKVPGIDLLNAIVADKYAKERQVLQKVGLDPDKVLPTAEPSVVLSPEPGALYTTVTKQSLVWVAKWLTPIIHQILPGILAHEQTHNTLYESLAKFPNSVPVELLNKAKTADAIKPNVADGHLQTERSLAAGEKKGDYTLGLGSDYDLFPSVKNDLRIWRIDNVVRQALGDKYNDPIRLPGKSNSEPGKIAQGWAEVKAGVMTTLILAGTASELTPDMVSAAQTHFNSLMSIGTYLMAIDRNGLIGKDSVYGPDFGNGESPFSAEVHGSSVIRALLQLAVIREQVGASKSTDEATKKLMLGLADKLQENMVKPFSEPGDIIRMTFLPMQEYINPRVQNRWRDRMQGKPGKDGVPTVAPQPMVGFDMPMHYIIDALPGLAKAQFQVPLPEGKGTFGDLMPDIVVEFSKSHKLAQAIAQAAIKGSDKVNFDLKGYSIFDKTLAAGLATPMLMDNGVKPVEAVVGVNKIMNNITQADLPKHPTTAAEQAKNLDDVRKYVAKQNAKKAADK
jgi:hypothetical protein